MNMPLAASMLDEDIVKLRRLKEDVHTIDIYALIFIGRLSDAIGLTLSAAVSQSMRAFVGLPSESGPNLFGVSLPDLI